MQRAHVLLVGGAGGIGRALIAALQRTPLNPIVTCTRRDEALERLVADAGGRLVPLDLADSVSIDAAAEAILQRFPDYGWLESVVMLASPPPTITGFRLQGPVELERQLTVQVAGPYRLLQTLLARHLVQRRRGTVVGVLSAALARSRAGHASHMGAYVVGKAAQEMLLTEMANDCKWLRVKYLYPAHVDTPMLEAFDPRYVAQLRQQGGITAPQQVADQIIELLNDEHDRPTP